MAARPIWPIAKAIAGVFFYALCSLGALIFADYALIRHGLPALRRHQALTGLQEHKLGQPASGPGRFDGTLHHDGARRAPSGSACAIWYGWVEHTRHSGRSSYTTTVCARGEDESLTLIQGERSAPLSLFLHDEHVALLKDSVMETLPTDRVALDLGDISSSRQIPPRMQRMCGRLPGNGDLHYREACVPPGTAVTVLGCQVEGSVQSCGTPPGAISVRKLKPVLRAYANGSLSLIRGAAACVGIALSLLAVAVFKLRELFARAA